MAQIREAGNHEGKWRLLVPVRDFARHESEGQDNPSGRPANFRPLARRSAFDATDSRISPHNLPWSAPEGPLSTPLACGDSSKLSTSKPPSLARRSRLAEPSRRSKHH